GRRARAPCSRSGCRSRRARSPVDTPWRRGKSSSVQVKDPETFALVREPVASAEVVRELRVVVEPPERCPGEGGESRTLAPPPLELGDGGRAILRRAPVDAFALQERTRAGREGLPEVAAVHEQVRIAADEI